VVFAVAFLTYLSSLAVLNAERGAKGADIESFGDAVWWSLVTMATVGYGDYVPVTTNGRIVAVGLMVVGISLLGLVGASVASAVVTRISGRAQEGQSAVKEDLEALRTEIAALRQALLDAGVTGLTQPSETNSAPPASPAPPASSATPAHPPSPPE
jgi:voltage-gated potassium channel